MVRRDAIKESKYWRCHWREREKIEIRAERVNVCVRRKFDRRPESVKLRRSTCVNILFRRRLYYVVREKQDGIGKQRFCVVVVVALRITARRHTPGYYVKKNTHTQKRASYETYIYGVFYGIA